MNIIGISVDSNSTACAVRDGEVLAAISEERFNKIKNYIGYPKKAVEFCVDKLKGEIDSVVLPSINADPLSILTHWTSRSVSERMREQNLYWGPKLLDDKDVHYLDIFPETADYDQYPGPEFWRQIDFRAPPEERAKCFRHLRKKMVSADLGVSLSQIELKEHHQCHAYYSYYASPFRGVDVLSFNMDGFGDHWCATLDHFDKEGVAHSLLATDQALLGRLYRFTTLNLKMKPLEDEFKVMGLAPYASEYHWRKPYEVFKEFLTVEGIGFKIKKRPSDFFFYYKEALESCRFDAIAGGLQKFLEEILVTWVTNAIEETGISRVVFSGGIALNVKAMMELTKIPTLTQLFVPPSGGDESLPIGGAYHKEASTGSSAVIPPLRNAYLGNQYTQKEIDSFVVREKLSKTHHIIENCSSRQVATLLKEGSVLGVFLGKMEFGARALGARSIIADPRSTETVKKINYKIKSRDFWMPFAPVVLKERFKDYFHDPKNLISPYMSIGFETTELGRQAIPAALHPADYTGRPQQLVREDNPPYYDIIKSFEKLTGVGALLNTSFNLHGLPIAMSLEDALHVLENSDLDGVLMESTLVLKK